MSNGVVLSLLAIASAKRIREISDRTNWKITMRGGKGGGSTSSGFFFSFVFHFCRDIVLNLNGSCCEREAQLCNCSEIMQLWSLQSGEGDSLSFCR